MMQQVFFNFSLSSVKTSVKEKRAKQNPPFSEISRVWEL
jgi:hypothetical protein